MGRPDETDFPHTPLGRYVLVRRLGQGGMGEVFEANDTKLGRKVAIKKLITDHGADPVYIERFEREARAAASIHHPNVVTLFGIEQEGTVPFLVMEFVSGGNVESALRRQGRLTWPDATRITADACRGLAAAHAEGMIHRDIKPSNLLRTTAGVTKVADFGLARFRNIDHSLTTSGVIVGTAAYMSPEQCRGDADITDLTDIYSLGATYYTLLTGHRPFERETAVQVQFAHCTAPVPDPRSLVPDLPEACATIIQRAMAKEPSDRFGSAKEMLSALERVGWLGDETDVQPAGAGLNAITPASTRDARAEAPTQRARIARRRPGHLVMAITGLVAVVALIVVIAIVQRSPRVIADGNGKSTQDGDSNAAVQPAIVLFDGSNLNEWNLTGRNGDRWKLQNGLLVGHGPNSYLFTNRGEWQDFHLLAELRCPAKANAGLFFRCKPNVGYAFGFEAQLGWNSATSDFGHIHIGTQSHVTRHINASVPSTVKPDQWITLEVIARGTHVETRIDGVVTASIDDAPFEPGSHIGLQAFTEGKAIEVRKITIRGAQP